MEQEVLNTLIKKYLDGTATEQERTTILNWYRNLSTEEIEIPLDNPEEKNIIKARIYEKLTAYIRDGQADENKPRYRWLAAAVIVGLVVLGGSLLLLNNQPKKQLLATAYGEKQAFILPDSSVVILNANSSVQYTGGWRKSDSREIWMSGEVFFNIKYGEFHRQSHITAKPFIVHVGNLNIQVLGTVFDVKARRNKVAVGLNSGKVKVTINGSTKRSRILKPGQVLIYNEVTDKISVSNKKAAKTLSSWTNNKMILNGATIGDLALYIEDYFGKKVIFQDTSMADREVEGTLILSNLDDVLFAISTAFNIEIIHHEDTLLFESKE